MGDDVPLVYCRCCEAERCNNTYGHNSNCAILRRGEDDEGGLAGSSVIFGSAHWSSGRRELDGAGEGNSDGRGQQRRARTDGFPTVCPSVPAPGHGMACPTMADGRAALMSQMVFNVCRAYGAH